MRQRTWKIIERGPVPEGARTIPFECACGYEAMLPVKGRVIAVNGDKGDHGVFFDNDEAGALPTTIQCRRCGRVLTTEPEVTSVR